MKKLYLLYIFLFAFFSLNAQDEGLVKSAFIYNFTKDLTWQNEDSLTDFKIAVYGNDTTVIIKGLRTLQKQKKIKNKPIKIYSSSNFNNILKFKPQIIYLTSDKNIELKKRYYDILNQNILLISENATNKLYVMINFFYDKQNASYRFEINRENIIAQNIEINEHLISLGGSELDVRELYKMKVAELQQEKQLIKQQQQRLEELSAKIEEKNKQLDNKKNEIERLKEEILQQKQELAVQQDKLSELAKELENKQKELEEKFRILQEQQDSIVRQKNIIEKQKTEIRNKMEHLDRLNEEIQKRETLLESQQKKVSELQSVVSAQKLSLYLAGAVVFLIILILIFIYRSYRQKQKLNKQLTEKNEQISKQAEELRAVNKELEKLSIVARETDNVIILLKPNGEFFWANEALQKQYGYTIDEVKKFFGNTIVEASTNSKIKQYYEQVIKTRKSVSYDNQITTKDGRKLWIQSTLTPIIDDNGNIKMLVIIDSDITKLKEYEQQIKLKNQELLAQTEELRAQKEQIQIQNDYIRSSIEYAKYIQNSILPRSDELKNFFEFFIIYYPKDIVSGDFYWFAHLPKKGELSEKFYASVVDCTGHGVPGALMSMLGSRLLSEIVKENKVTSPNEILVQLDKKLKDTLQQPSEANSYDGMDLSIIRLEPDKDGYILTMAMAKTSVFLYKKTERKIIRYRGTPKSIGGFISPHNKSVFENIEIKVSKGDIIYLATDGYIDQNNSSRKRFGTQRFIALLQEVAALPLLLQKKILEQKFQEWKNGEIQRDDVTIWTIKI